MKEFEIQKQFFKDIISFKDSIYGELVFNNIYDTLEKTFPITASLLRDNFKDLVKQFIRKKTIKTPYLSQIPEYFIEFIKTSSEVNLIQIPYIYELMDFEWIEIVLFNTDFPKDISKFSWNKIMFLSRTCSLKHYTYPVHKIGAISLSKIKDLKGNYYLVIYNSPVDYEVSYIEISKFLFDILKNIGNQDMETTVKLVVSKYNISIEDIRHDLKKFFVFLSKEKILI